MPDTVSTVVPAPTPVAKPDAVLIPTSMRRGKSSVARGLSLITIADQLLDVRPEAGERSCGYKIIPLNRVMMFTKSLTDSYLFPKGSPMAGQARYVWKKMPDGTTFGYLVPEPKE